MLRGAAHAYLGNAHVAETEFVTGRVLSIASGDSALEAELELYAAFAAFGAGDVHEARRATARGLERASDAGASASSFTPLTHIVARLYDLQGLIAAAAGKYLEQAASTRAALDIWDADADIDVWHQAFAMMNFATVTSNFDLRADAQDIARRAGVMAWTPELTSTRFRTYELLSWNAMIAGDQLAAMRYFREADRSAVTTPDQVFIATDRSIQAHALSYDLVAIEQAEHAARLAQSIDWNEASGDSRNALVWLAQALVFFAPVEARAVLSRHGRIQSAMPAAYSARLERRIRAEESYTHGIVLRAEGQIYASTERLRTAFEIWNEIGFAWRAARAAVELVELDAGDMYRLAVRRELHDRPASVFAERARLAA